MAARDASERSRRAPARESGPEINSGDGAASSDFWARRSGRARQARGVRGRERGAQVAQDAQEAQEARSRLPIALRAIFQFRPESLVPAGSARPKLEELVNWAASCALTANMNNKRVPRGQAPVPARRMQINALVAAGRPRNQPASSFASVESPLAGRPAGRPLGAHNNPFSSRARRSCLSVPPVWPIRRPH